MSSRAMKDIQDLEKEAKVATSILQRRANDVRGNAINWTSYLQGQMISKEMFDFMAKFDKSTTQVRATLVNQNPEQFAAIFRSLIEKIAKDQTLQYVLTLLDDALQEDSSRVSLLRAYAKKRRESVWQPFFQLLERDDLFIVHQSSCIVAKMACWSKEPMETESLQSYLHWLKDQLRVPNNEYHITVVRCLQMMLRVDAYRNVFVKIDGMTVMVSLLTNHQKIGFQLTYQLVFCLWCLSFNSDVAVRMHSLNMIPLLTDVFASNEREKVRRVVLALFRNLLEKPGEDHKPIVQDYALGMIRCKVDRHLETWSAKNLTDADITDDMDWLMTRMANSVHDLSSYDEYASELKSGNLEWSPAHKSDRFWGENAIRFNDNNYELLRILVRLLESSRDPLVLSVAAHDIGQYVRHYPRGKHILEQLGAKQRVMLFLTHEDPNVRYESLLALQKLMVHNWEYLGKKMTEEQSKYGGLMLDVKS